MIENSNDNNLPRHIAIIPDGNRRWARKRGLAPWRGHLAGAETTKELLETALNQGIYCVSLWGGSWENLTERSNMEVKFLIGIYDQYCRKLAKRKEIKQDKIKINIFGRWKDVLPKRTIARFQKLINVTKDYTGRILNFYIAYNGTDEMLCAIKDIVRQAQNKRIKITEDLLKKNLWTGELPPVDLMIRTGSDKDPHNSKGFMMWHCAESQMHFAKEFYPDFKKKQFEKVIKDYQKRERRHGK